jgi:transmembrane sensor
MQPLRHKKKLIRLLEKYRDGRATAEESRFVEQYGAYLENGEPLSGRLSAEEIRSLEDRLLTQLHSRMDAREVPRVVPLYRLPWVRAAVAVVLVLGISAIVWKNLRPAGSVVVVAAAGPHDIFPGKSGAVLTLGSGKQVLLDNNAAGGTIPRQGNTKVTNGAGLLAYRTPVGAPASAIYYNTLHTERGNQYKLILPDGTQVWLNAASSITYPTAFTGAERKVTVTGEAYFAVVHNPQQPFIVQAGGQEIKDIGTEFNINAYPDEPGIATTLVEGQVQVQTLVLKPGEQAIVSKGSGLLRLVSHADIEQATAWKNGEIVLHSADLGALLRSVARWYDVEVEIKGTLPERTFFLEGSRRAKLSELIRGLEVNHIHCVIDAEHRKLTVTP